MQKADFVSEAEAMYESLRKWREAHPGASFDEIAEAVREKRQALMGGLLKELAEQEGIGDYLADRTCPECGGVMHYKGERKRGIGHSEGATAIERGYHQCSQCGHTFSPLDEALKLVDHYWSPAMLSQALRIGTEIPSFRRAAALFSELTHVSLSKSTLQRMSQAYGAIIDDERTAEATAMVRVPSREEEINWRAVPEPDSPLMNVSSDGAMIHLRDEGWKEVKTVAISAVEATLDDETGDIDVQLTKHSYRAGLWDAKDFANQLWAESCQRGLGKATQLTSVNDGARWIWAIVLMCFTHCIQILDWWHAVQYLWTIAGAACGDDHAAATLWVDAQKRLLAQSNLRQVMKNIRLLCPRGQTLPDPVLKAVTYLFHNRWRMCYREFRAAGCPIGSGTVESACKVVVQQRMKQAGMRWSRNGAQAMLALRSALLSDHWDAVEKAISPP